MKRQRATESGSVYVVVNLIDGRCYVGQTRYPVSHRWNVHKSEARRRCRSVFHQAIRNFGEDAFEVYEVAKAASIEQLDELERLWVILMNSKSPENGYNSVAGGAGIESPNAETRERMSASARNRPPVSEKTRQKLSAAGKGKVHSDEHNRKKSIALKGRKPSEACIAAVAEANSKRVCSPETREKLRLAAQKANKIRWGK